MKDLNSLKKNSLLISLLLLLTACNNPQTMYHSYQSIPNKGWYRGDTLFFPVEVTDSLTTLDLSVEVRNIATYPYADLYLTVTHNLGDSTRFVTDTLTCLLANEDGAWIGKGWGTLYQLNVPYTTIQAPQKGTHQLKVAHVMRDEQLKGIDNVGIKIKKNTP